MDPFVTGLILGSIITGGFVYWMGIQYTRAERLRVQTETRRRIIDHLRDNARGLTLLDAVTVRDVEIVSPDPVTVLGDDNTIINSTFNMAPKGGSA